MEGPFPDADSPVAARPAYSSQYSGLIRFFFLCRQGVREVSKGFMAQAPFLPERD